MSSGTTLKEIQRFFEYLKQSKTNNEMTILITNSMCKDLQFMVENLCNYRDLLEKRIDQAIEYIKNKPLYSETYDYNDEEELEIHNISDLEAREDLLEILGDKE